MDERNPTDQLDLFGIEQEDMNFLQKFFCWSTLNILPFWLLPEGAFATWLINLFWVDCPYCLLMRGLFVGFVLGLMISLSSLFLFLII